jgi:hypothetical protein
MEHNISTKVMTPCVLILSLAYRLLKFQVTMDRLVTGKDDTTYTTAGGTDMKGSVQLQYGGSTALTVSPSISLTEGTVITTTSSITTGTTIQIPKSGSKFSFKVGTSVVATIWNHDDENKVEIKGGSSIANTTPFTVVTNLV